MKISQIQKALDSVTPRGWQADGIAPCLTKLRKEKICVVEAVTGGGKTFFGALIAATLAVEDDIDEVVIVSPSTNVKQGWAETLNRFGIVCTAENYENAGIDAISVTYQGLENEEVMVRLESPKRRLLVIDEFHHAERDAKWGASLARTAEKCGMFLFLSGTPWRSDGDIAMLKEHGYYHDGLVKADIKYGYASDLKAYGDDRGTVYAEFVFFDSKAKNKETGKEVVYRAPNPGEPLSVFAKQECNEPLGFHVAISDSNISENQMARSMLEYGVSQLDIAMRCTKGKAIGLVVCRNISEARCIEFYLTERLNQRAEVIASDDANASTRLREIKRLDRTRSPDWIVSVGMVSEGVDIPQIKVVVYLSAITTLLYLVQVIGRALRRINIGKNGETKYIDEKPSGTRGFVLMPAHPFLIWLAEQFENDIREAEKAKGKPRDPSERSDPQPQLWSNDGGTELSSVLSGVSIERQVMEMLDLLSADKDASEIVNDQYKECVRKWLQVGKAEFVLKELKRLCDEHSVQVRSEVNLREHLDYDAKVKAAKNEAHRYVSKIRYKMRPYSEIKDDRKAFTEIRLKFNRECNISSFDTATLEQMEKWVAKAKAFSEKGAC